ncbi:MAG: DMT family protein [Alistipes sp.]|jgi:uncharacterized protein (DUF486 family)|nr:DMT family protein [Alistipes sp.]MBR5201280.1 DMT family protein [Alistipes sp.]
MLGRGLSTIALLVCSNIFMTLAWYGHIAFKDKLERFTSPDKPFLFKGMLVVILISWGVALLEYCFQVPANRLGSTEFGGPFTLWHLKVIQEVISLVVFSLFMAIFLHEGLKWNHYVGFLCLVLAVYFIFRK